MQTTFDLSFDVPSLTFLRKLEKYLRSEDSADKKHGSSNEKACTNIALKPLACAQNNINIA